MDVEQMAVETTLQEVHVSRRPFFSFFLLLASLPLFLYLLPFFLLRMQSLDRWTLSAGGKTMDYGYSVTKADADVVIFGESSALYGVDPRQMSASLGLKVINLPNDLGSLVATEDMVLESYLQKNSPPKLLVIYLAPWNVDFVHTKQPLLLYEGEEMLARHGTLSEMARFAANHFIDFLQFPFKFYRIFSGDLMRSHPASGPSFVADHMGHLEDSGQNHLSGSCEIPAKFVSEGVRMTSARLALDHYRRPPVNAIVFVSPIPGCTNGQAFGDRKYSDIPAAPPQVLPPADFMDDGFFIHLHKSAVPEATDELLKVVKPALGTGSAQR